MWIIPSEFTEALGRLGAVLPHADRPEVDGGAGTPDAAAEHRPPAGRPVDGE